LHFFPNNSHWGGEIIPCSTSPQRQPGRSPLPPSIFKLYFFSASNPEYFDLNCKPLLGISPSPRHRLSLTFSMSAITLRAVGFPSALTTREYSFATLDFPVFFWLRMDDRASKISPGSNPAIAPGILNFSAIK